MKRLFQALFFLVVLALMTGRGKSLWLLIPFLVAALMLRRRRSKSPKAASGPKPEWKKKLDEALLQIRNELQARAKHLPSTDTGWEALEASPEPGTAEKGGPAVEAERGGETVPEPVHGGEAALKPPPARLSAAGRQGAESGVSSRPSWRKPGPKALRRALVWSEILAPPVALRDGSGIDPFFSGRSPEDVRLQGER